MATDNTKQNPAEEVEPLNEDRLNEETLEKMNGGVVSPYFGTPIKKHLPKPTKPFGPKDGGATGSW